MLIDLNPESWFLCLTSHDSERKYELHKERVIAFYRLEATMFPPWEEIPAMQKSAMQSILSLAWVYAAWLLAHNKMLSEERNFNEFLFAALFALNSDSDVDWQNCLETCRKKCSKACCVNMWPVWCLCCTAFLDITWVSRQGFDLLFIYSWKTRLKSSIIVLDQRIDILKTKPFTLVKGISLLWPWFHSIFWKLFRGKCLIHSSSNKLATFTLPVFGIDKRIYLLTDVTLQSACAYKYVELVPVYNSQWPYVMSSDWIANFN